MISNNYEAKTLLELKNKLNNKKKRKKKVFRNMNHIKIEDK